MKAPEIIGTWIAASIPVALIVGALINRGGKVPPEPTSPLYKLPSHQRSTHAEQRHRIAA